MDVKKPRWARLGSAPVFRAAKPVPAVGASGANATPTPRGSGLLRVLLHVRGWRTGGPQWTSGSGRGYAVSAFRGVTGYASSAGFGFVFTGGKPCKAERNLNLSADLRSAARKLIRSSTVVTPARCDVDIKLGRSNSTNRVSCL